MYYVYLTYLIGREKVIKEEEGFSLVLQVDGKNPLHLHERRKSTFALKETSDLPQKKNSRISYYPNKEFGFKVSYACISNISVGTVFCLFRSLAKIESEGDGKPP